MSKIIKSYKGINPDIHETCYLSENITVIGDVHIDEDTSVWYGSVIRGDVNKIRIGKKTNIQDGTIIHVATFGQGTHIGDKVTIGHQALLHDCTLHDKSYIGMQSCVMDGAIVESQAFVAAGSLVPPRKVIPSGQLWGGRPARYMRDLHEDDYRLIEWSWEHYRKLADEHKNDH